MARGGTLNLAGVAISAAATLGVTVLVTRQFSKPVAGTFFAAISLFLIIESVASLGAFTGLVYFITRLRSLHAETRIPAILRAALLPVAISSSIAAGALLLLAGPIARGLLGGHVADGTDPAAVAAALRLLAATLPFAALLDTLLGATRGYRDMLPTVAVDRIGRSALQLLGVAAAAASGTAALLAPLWALPYIPAAVAAFLWLRRIRRHNEPGGRPSRQPHQPNARGFWRFTAPRALAAIAQITIQRLDIVLVGLMRGPAAAALYTAATRFLVAGQLGNQAISMAAQPQLTHLFAVGDRRGANRVYQATTAWLVLLTWPLYLLAVIYGPAVLAIFGRSYRAGTVVMVILGLTMLLATACGQVDVVLITAGRSTWSLANGLLAVSVNVAVDLALIPRYGITGAAIGWAAAIVLTNLLPLAQVAAVIRVHPFGRGTMAACVLSALCFGVIPLTARALLGDSAAVSALAIAAGSVAAAAMLWRLRKLLELSVLPGPPVIVRRLRPSNSDQTISKGSP